MKRTATYLNKPSIWTAVGLVLSLVASAEYTRAQQTITYTNGETDNTAIVITAATNPTTLSISSGSATQSGTISDNGDDYAVDKSGSGELILTGANTYTGLTTVEAGTLALGAGGSIASTTGNYPSGIDLANSGTVFDISSGGNQNIQTLSGVSGSTVNLGTNTLTLGEVGYFSTFSFGGIIEGGGGITVHSGLTLSGVNTYTGVTTINKNCDLTVTSGGSISDSSEINLAASGATFSVGSSQTIQDLVGVAGTTVNIDPGDILTVGAADSTTFAGSITNGNQGFIKQGTGTLTLTGISTYFGTTVINGGTLALGSGGSASGTTIDLANTGTTFDISQGGNQNIEGLNGVSDTAVNLGANTLTVSQLGGQPGGVSTFGGTVQGTGGLIKSNTGSLVLTGTNTYSGPTTISAGTLQFGNEVSLYNDNEANWTSTNLTIASGSTLALNVGGQGEFTSGDLSTLLQNLGTGTGGFANLSTIGFDTTYAEGGTFTYNGLISDTHSGASVLGLIQLGNGTLVLSAKDTYSGTTTVQAGTLAIGAGGGIANSSSIILSNNGTTFDISQGGNQTIKDLVSYTTQATVNLGANSLTEGTANSTTFSGTIQGSGGLIKQNSGTLMLSGTNTYTGLTTISGGTVEFQKEVSLYDDQTASWTAANINVASNSTLALGVGGSGQFTSSDVAIILQALSTGSGGFYNDSNIALDTGSATGGNFNFSGTIANGQSGANVVGLTKLGSNTLTLTGINTYTGATTISAGTLVVGGAGQLGGGSYEGNITSNGIFAYSSSANQTLSGNILESGFMEQNGPGTLTLLGTNTFSGTIELNGGVLNVGSSGALGGTADIAFDGGTLQYSAANTTDYSSRFDASYPTTTEFSIDTNGQKVTFASGLSSFGTASLVKLGLGSLTLNGANTYSGGTTVAGGLLVANSTNSTGSGQVVVNSGASLGGTGTIATSGVTSGNAVTFQSAASLNQSAVSGGLGTSTLSLNLRNGGTTTTVDFVQGAKFAFNLGSTGVSDQAIVTGGTITLNSQNFSDFTFTALSGFTGAGTYDLLVTDGAGDLLGSLGTTTGSIDGYNATLSVVNSQDLQLTLNGTLAPEPSSWSLLLSGVGLFAFIRTRSRHCNNG